MLVASLLAMGQAPTQTAGGAPQGNMLTMFAPLAIIFVIFYFLLIRPQQKQQKKLQQMLANLKNGDRVVTSGGIHGTIVGMKDQEYIVLRVPPEQVKLEVLRSAVVTVQQPAEEQK